MIDKAKLDQAAAALRDSVPALVRSVYTGSIEAGFSEQQAMDLAKTALAVMLTRAFEKPDGDNGN